MPDTSDVRRVGDTLKSQFNDAVDQASTLASGAADTIREQGSRLAGTATTATDAIREQGSRLAGSAQALYDDLEGDNAGAKLRGVIAANPVASLLVAAAAGYLISRVLHD